MHIMRFRVFNPMADLLTIGLMCSSRVCVFEQGKKRTFTDDTVALSGREQ